MDDGEIVYQSIHQLNHPINPNVLTATVIFLNNKNYHPRFRNPGKNTVSTVIGGYKSAITKRANRLGLENGWQSRFQNQIIRAAAAYQ